MELDFDNDILFLALQEQHLRENHERMERMEEAEVQILRQAVSSSNSSSSSDEESEEESTTISILNVEQKIEIKKSMEVFESFQEPEGQPPRYFETLTFSTVPLFSVHFKDLDKIDEAIKEAEDNIKPYIRLLRNYIRKKKIENDEPVISLIPGMVPPGDLKDFLDVDKNLLQKLSSCFCDPFIKIKLEVKRTKQLPNNVFRGSDSRKETESFQFDFEKGKLKVSEVLNNSDKIRIPLKRVDKKAEVKNTMQALMRSDNNSSVTFKLSFEVEVGEVPGNKEIKLGSDLILQSIYNLEGKDVTIIAANGAEIKCHKNILIAQSEPFYSMLTPEYEMMEVQTGKIEMKENSEEGLRQFVKLLYGFPLPVGTITCEMAVELLQLANKYGVRELEGSMIDFLCLKDMQFYNADTILELYYYTRNIESLGELTTHALTEMSTLSEKSLTGCEYFKKLPRDDAVKLLCTLLQWKN